MTAKRTRSAPFLLFLLFLFTVHCLLLTLAAPASGQTTTPNLSLTEPQTVTSPQPWAVELNADIAQIDAAIPESAVCTAASSLGFLLNGTDETAKLNSVLLAFYNHGGGCLAIDCGKTLRADSQIVLPNAGTVTYGLPPYSITSLTSAATVATATVATTGTGGVSNFTAALVGTWVLVAGATPSGYNGPHQITSVSGSTFTYTVSSGLTTPATGTITFTGLGYPWLQPPMRITSFCGSPGNYSDAIDCTNAQLYGVSGSSCMGAAMSAMQPSAVLDLRYSGSGITAYQGGPKLLTLGSGRFELDHLTITTGGTDCATLFMSTLTSVSLHDNAWIGYRALGNSWGCSDDIQLGGTGNTTQPLTNTVADRYTGYGSEIYNNFFSRSRQLVVTGGGSPNALHIHHNTNDQSCGYNAGSQAPYSMVNLTGSDVSFNLVELYGYNYGFYLTGASGNSLIGNQLWDSSTAYHYCSDLSSSGNYIVDLSSSSLPQGCPAIYAAANANTLVTPGQVLAPKIAFSDGTWQTTGYNNTGSPGSSVYVDTFNGNDASSSCSSTYPCKTVAGAYVKAPSATTAYVRASSAGAFIALPAVSTGWQTVRALYLLAEGSGSTTLYDIANGFNITLPASNSPTWNTSTPTKGLAFAAASQQYIAVPAWSNFAGASVNLEQPMTYVFVDTTASHPSGWECPFDYEAGAAHAIIDSSGNWRMEAGSSATTGLTNTIGTVEMFAGVFNGASSFGVKGSSAGSTISPGTYGPGSNVYFGTNYAKNGYFDGTMSMYLFFNAALTSSDLTSTVHTWAQTQMSTYHGITLP